MKRLLLLTVLCLILPVASQAQTETVTSKSDRMFFPHDTFYGWAQFEIAPPHNEIDPNLCAGNAGSYGGVNAPCSMFARYMISGDRKSVV